MLRILCGVMVFGACTSEPDTCDQHVAGDIQLVCASLRATVDTGSAMHVTASFPCEGGGSGTMQIGGNVQWSGVFTFDACAKTFNGSTDMLTLTGTVMMMGDSLNDAYQVTVDVLTIQGEVSTCGAPVDETCPGSWGPSNDTMFGYENVSGTLCGRNFP